MSAAPLSDALKGYGTYAFGRRPCWLLKAVPMSRRPRGLRRSRWMVGLLRRGSAGSNNPALAYPQVQDT